MLDQINVVVADMDATVAFYRRLGLALQAAPGDFHVDILLPNGMRLEFDRADTVHVWDSGFDGSTGGSTVIGFGVASREAVDALVEELTTAGYRVRQRPYDAFWGARYAIVLDPDGNRVGLMSPIDKTRKFWPPQPAPAG